ncbi:hypothetical protein PORY_000992 [Pneumocystis oryctolagi]|uniref:Uncharacterized protein n=1 Tax=Pneumocystis oryctolagi TaxID=42067 RepID=A0ACB7CCS6_9ASCO|nr:hypothetical protein PORY_000992 [Pneumocystis oryctolagi]
MSTEMQLLNSPKKRILDDTDFGDDSSPSKELGVKRVFNEITNEDMEDESSPVLSKKASFISKKLKQPFRSPLKAGNNTIKPLEFIQKDEKPDLICSNNSSVEENENIEPATVSETTSTCTKSTPKKSVKKAVFRSPLVLKKSDMDPKIAALHKRKLELERKIWETDEHIKTLETAKMYENKDDTKLERLIEKWRTAAQQAASQLFTIVSERIEAAGGIVAWYKQFEISENVFSKWGYAENTELENEEQDKISPNTEETPKSEKFTMAMMLEKLNISPNLIGWDIETETWL